MAKDDEKSYKGKKGDDNYKRLSFYEDKTKNIDFGFGSFATDDGTFYFAYNVEGRSILISESYSSSSGRDNGVNSVTKNMKVAERFVRKVHSNGKHYFNLLAGNNQEIATSRWFESEGAMNDAISFLLRGGGGTSTGDLIARADYKAAVSIEAAVVNNEAPKEKKPRKKRKKSTKPKAEKVYLKNGDYLFNAITYRTMRSSNDRHYFAFRNEEEKTVLLNANVRGFETELEVDAAVDNVMKFAPYEKNYEGKTTKNAKYYFYLNDEEGKHIGKSFFFNTTDEMQVAIGLFIGDMNTVPVVPEKKTPVIDDYLPCGDYSGGEWFHTFFKGENEEHYFAYNSPDGKTYLRSEGYTTSKARDNGIESVKKNAPIEGRWTTGETDKIFYYALKAGNHQEIARSCDYSSKSDMESAFSWVRGEQSILGEGAKMVDGKWMTAYALRMNKENTAAASAAAAAAAASLVIKQKEENDAKLKEEENAKRRKEEAKIKEENELKLKEEEHSRKAATVAAATAAAAALEIKQKADAESKRKKEEETQRVEAAAATAAALMVKQKAEAEAKLKAKNEAQRVQAEVNRKEESKKVAAAAALAATALVTKQKEAAQVKLKEEKKKVAAASALTASALAAKTSAASEKVTETKKRKFAWWWLLPLLLLLAALYFLKGCEGCNSTTAPVVVGTEEVKENIAKETNNAIVETKEVETSAIVATEKEVADNKADIEAEANAKAAEAKRQADIDAAAVKAAAEERRLEEERAREEKAKIEREKLIPAIGVEAGFERVNINK